MNPLDQIALDLASLAPMRPTPGSVILAHPDVVDDWIRQQGGEPASSEHRWEVSLRGILVYRDTSQPPGTVKWSRWLPIARTDLP